MKKPTIHYVARIRYTSRSQWVENGGGGYPICCSGDRAYAIEASGMTTVNFLHVTCKRCKDLLRKAERIATDAKDTAYDLAQKVKP